VIVAYGGAAAPVGWLLCDGSSVLRATYAALFAVVGTAYGSVDGTHFTVPDLRRAFPMGKSASDSLGGVGGSFDHGHTMTQASDHAGPTHSGTAVANHVFTQPGGHSAHVFTQPTQAAHTHDAHTMTASGSSGATRASAPVTHSSVAPTISGGAVDAHSAHSGGAVDAHAVTQPSAHSALTHAGASVATNNPPYVVVNYIIKT
jgi:microcystin-dependent protein